MLDGYFFVGIAVARLQRRPRGHAVGPHGVGRVQRGCNQHHGGQRAGVHELGRSGDSVHDDRVQAGRDVRTEPRRAAPRRPAPLTPAAGCPRYLVYVTVEHLDAYDTLYYTADDCSYNQLSIIDSAMIECTTPSGAGMGTEFVMASRGGGLAQSVQGSGVSCVPDANGAITVRVNHQFRYYEYTDPQTGSVSYVPYGKPLAAGTASWCNYATGTEFEYSNPPVDTGTPCQLFTPSTQAGIWVSRMEIVTPDQCSGSVLSTTDSRLADGCAQECFPPTDGPCIHPISKICTPEDPETGECYNGQVSRCVSTTAGTSTTEATATPSTTTTTTTATTTILTPAEGVCSYTATFGAPARPPARPLARRA